MPDVPREALVSGLRAEPTKVQYEFEIGRRDKNSFDRLLARESEMPDHTLCQELKAAGYESNYDGHFGRGVWVEIDDLGDDTSQRLQQIGAIIRRHLSLPRLPAKEDLALLTHEQRRQLILKTKYWAGATWEQTDCYEHESIIELWRNLEFWDDPELLQATWEALGWGQHQIYVGGPQ